MASSSINRPVSRAPDGLDIDKINAVKGAKQLGELAAQFDPPVSTAKCNSVTEKKERLRCAYRKYIGQSVDLEAFGETMERLKITDGQKREELSNLFKRTKRILTEISKEDSVVDQQLGQEDWTKDYQNKIDRFQELLHCQECPVVVAGQVSSGKSTLLNLFLGQEVLPSQLLSCTATICELAYNSTERAEILQENGVLEEIPFSQKDSFIFKASERERRFEHDAVKLYMPVPFLKSGITLVDTPGVGESKQMGDVLLEYVAKKDVFGFIFAIKCDDAGGVLNRFKEMLRQLATIKDRQGQYKFDPQSVIFVANFWDKVPKDEQKLVSERIESTLEQEPCLKGINLKHQLFYLNSRFAWNTWEVGLISEEYEKLIQGIRRFFPIGHKRKLKLSYMWLENLLMRSLHPVNAYLNKAEHSYSSLQKKTGSAFKVLMTVGEKVSSANEEMNEFYNGMRKRLMQNLEKFLRSEEARKLVTWWRIGDIPKEEYGDSWILLEERLDQAVDNRMSKVLQDWEVMRHIFQNAENEIMKELKLRYSNVFNQLEELEKSLRDMSGDEQRAESVKPSKFAPQLEEKEREFKVDVAHGLSGENPHSLHGVLSNMLINPAALFKMDKNARQKIQQKSAENYQRDRVKFMAEKSEVALLKLRESDGLIAALVEDQLQVSKQNIDKAQQDSNEKIVSNRILADGLLNDKRQGPQLAFTYRPFVDKLNSILEDSLNFMYGNILEYDFAQGSLLTSPTSPVPKKYQISIVSETSHAKAGKVDVTVKYIPQGSAFKKRHYFYITNNLRSLSKYRKGQRCMAELLGTGLLSCVPVLVFRSKLITARQYLLASKPKKGHRGVFLQTMLTNFMIDVNKGIEFLHLKRLVHLELSLDSVLVDGRGIPKLTNVSESAEIPIPVGNEELSAGNYVYMAPETFQGGRYTSAADVYALGLMLLELWCQCDLYQNVKCKKLLEFIIDRNPGKTMYQCTDTIDQRSEILRGLPVDLVQKCLDSNLKMRLTSRQWSDEFETFCQGYFHETQV